MQLTGFQIYAAGFHLAQKKLSNKLSLLILTDTPIYGAILGNTLKSTKDLLRHFANPL